MPVRAYNTRIKQWSRFRTIEGSILRLARSSSQPSAPRLPYIGVDRVVRDEMVQAPIRRIIVVRVEGSDGWLASGVRVQYFRWPKRTGHQDEHREELLIDRGPISRLKILTADGHIHIRL